MAGGVRWRLGIPEDANHPMSDFLSRLGGSALDGLRGTPLDRILNHLMGGQAGASGLEALLDRLRGGGLGSQVDSWISTGRNEPVAPQQLERALGEQDVDRMAREAGVDRGGLLGGLSALLPMLVDGLTPRGRVPASEEEMRGGLSGMLGGLLGGGGTSGGLGDLLGGATAGGGGLAGALGALFGGGRGDAPPPEADASAAAGGPDDALHGAVEEGAARHGGLTGDPEARNVEDEGLMPPGATGSAPRPEDDRGPGRDRDDRLPRDSAPRRRD